MTEQKATITKEELEVYARYQTYLLEARARNFEHFDKAIMTLSGGALALSLSFIDNIVPLSSAAYKWIVISAWAFFSISIISIISSYISNQYAYDKQLKLAEDYYLNDDQEALRKRNKPAAFTKACNIGSAISFIVAVAFLLLFVSMNITSEVSMSSQKDTPRPTPNREVHTPSRPRSIPEPPAPIPLKPPQTPSPGTGGTGGAGTGQPSEG